MALTWAVSSLLTINFTSGVCEASVMEASSRDVMEHKVSLNGRIVIFQISLFCNGLFPMHVVSSTTASYGSIEFWLDAALVHDSSNFWLRIYVNCRGVIIIRSIFRYIRFLSNCFTFQKTYI